MASSQADTPVSASAFGCITIPFLLIALIPLGWGARANWMNGQLARDGEVVSGRVVDIRYVADNPSVKLGKGSGESAVVTFMTRDGQERTAVSSVNRYPAPWSIGQTVEVVYDAANPNRADLFSELSGWRLWFGIWCAIAALPAAIALAPVALLIRQRKQASSVAGRP